MDVLGLDVDVREEITVESAVAALIVSWCRIIFIETENLYIAEGNLSLLVQSYQ